MSVTGETTGRSVGTHVFISYSKADRAFAEATCVRLENAGVKCWMAPRDILAGAIWGEAIIDAIITSQLMILVFSRSANKSQQVAREVERAASRGVPLLPLRIEDVPLSKALELYLSTSQWLDAFTPPREQHLDRLLAAVQRLLGPTTSREPVQRPSQPDATPASVASAPQPATRATRKIPIGGLVLGGIVASAAAVWALSSTFSGSRGTPPRPVLAIVGTKPIERVVGDTFALTATVDGKPRLAASRIRWSSSDTAVVRVGPTNGILLAVAPGEALLFAAVGDSRDSVRVNVRPPASAPVAASPPPVVTPSPSGDSRIVTLQAKQPAAPIYVGDSLALTVRALDSAGRPLKPLKLRWRSLTPNVASVDSVRGLLRGLARGQATIAGNAGPASTRVSVAVIDQEAPSRPPHREPTETTAKPNVPVSTPTLTAEMKRALAEECVTALRKPDRAWLSAHYAGTTTGDQANLRALLDLLTKRGYAAQEIPLETANQLTDFQMRFSHVTAFGPKRTTNAVFRVVPALNSGRWEVGSCRVNGTLAVP